MNRFSIVKINLLLIFSNAATLLLPRCNSFVALSTTTSLTTTAITNRDALCAFSTQKQEDNSAASKYSGAGSATVDMNRYNLPLEKIATEWVANLVPQSVLQEEGVYLGARSHRVNFVDTLTFTIPRNKKGLGLVLLEIAGGRSDGLGITIVDETVEGGNAAGSGIMAGDSIVALTLPHTKEDLTADADDAKLTQQLDRIVAVSTECLSYDATVEAIQSLPPPQSNEETINITVKRLRRKPRVLVKLQYPPSQNMPDSTIELFAGENLRRAMLTRGVKLNDKLSRRFDTGGTGDCGAEGSCATCVVSIRTGADLISPIKTQEKQILVKNPRWRLACRTIVGYGMKEGNMIIKVNPRQWKENL